MSMYGMSQFESLSVRQSPITLLAWPECPLCAPRDAKSTRASDDRPKQRAFFWIIVPTIESEGNMRIKTWRRVGVVLSVVWLLVGGYWGNSAELHRGDFAVMQFTACMENSGTPDNASGACLNQFDRDYAQAIKNHWRGALIAGIVPIPVVWLLVYGLIGLVRRRRL
jgi:hypothetical protein